MKFLSIFLLVFTVSCASKKTKEESINKKAKLYYNQGTQQLVAKNYTKALKYLIEANTLKPDDAKTLNNLGMTFYFKGKKERGVRYIKRSIEIDPKYTKARQNLATIYVNLGKLKEAKEQYDLVLDDLTFEAQYKTYYNLGILHLKLGNNNQAINYFKQSLNENQNYCPSHFYLGEIYYQEGQYNKALSSYKSSGYGTCYNNPAPIYHQALSYIKLKKFDNAKLKLEEILDRFKTSDYQKKAKVQLQALNTLAPESDFDRDLRKLKNGKILTPNF